MGKSLGLVSCTKSKHSYACSAEEMYQASDLFKKACNYAVENYDYVAILSAKYGLLLPDETIKPYNLTLKSMNSSEQRKWAERAFRQMKNKLPMNKISKVFFHASLPYRRYLADLLEAQGIQCIIPLEGLGLGRQKAWYLKQTRYSRIS